MALDAQTLRRVLHDMFRFNPKDFRVQGSPTGFLVNLNSRSSNIADSVKPAFGWYVAPVTDDAPDPKNLNIKLRKGRINGSVTPENMAATFSLIPGTTDVPKTNYIRLTTTQSADGTVTLAVISISTDEILPDPPGSLDIAPATSSRDLWILETTENKVVDESAQFVGGLEIFPQLIRTECGESLWKMAWAHGL